MTTLRELMAQSMLQSSDGNQLRGLLAEPQNGLLGPWGQPSLNWLEEYQFQQWIKALPWYQEFQQQYGGPPNLDDSQYDYRAAWKAGIQPERDPYDNNRYHWPSTDPRTGTMLKSKDHPTAWKEQFMRETGVNPDEAGLKSPQDVERWRRRERP